MADIQLEQNVEASSQACYDALLDILPSLGYEIIKKRPMAYLLQAKGDLDGAPVSINAIGSMFPPTKVTITCSSDKASEEQLQEAAQAILAELTNQ